MNFLMQLPKDKLGHALAGLIIFNFALLFLNVVTSLILVAMVAWGKRFMIILTETSIHLTF
jgi:hypothetical protein